MKQVESIIEHLQSIKDSLIMAVQTSENPHDLSSKLIELVKKDPENADIYQLIVLVNSNLETDQKSFRIITLRVINDIITSKISSLQKIKDLENRMDAFTKREQGVNVPYVGVLKLKDLWMFAVSIFMILLISNILYPEATERTLNQVKEQVTKK